MTVATIEAHDAADGGIVTQRSARRLRVLVVDGHPDCADSLQMLLALAGYDVQQARTGAAALRRAASFLPDVAVIDLVLPEIDGLALAPQLRTLPGLANLLLIALTGLGDAAYRHRAYDAGYAYHWLKPVDPDLLLETLAELAERRHPEV